MAVNLKHGSRSTYNNHGCRCDECRTAHRIYWQNNPNRRKQQHVRKLFRNYGISENEYLTMLVLQDSKCAICEKDFPPETGKGKGPNVDHDHKTGEIRALLCFRCNAGLGNFNDSIELLKFAVRYLERY